MVDLVCFSNVETRLHFAVRGCVETRHTIICERTGRYCDSPHCESITLRSLRDRRRWCSVLSQSTETVASKVAPGSELAINEDRLNRDVLSFDMDACLRMNIDML